MLDEVVTDRVGTDEICVDAPLGLCSQELTDTSELHGGWSTHSKLRGDRFKGMKRGIEKMHVRITEVHLIPYLISRAADN
jgi:hypothetical protein